MACPAVFAVRHGPSTGTPLPQVLARWALQLTPCSCHSPLLGSSRGTTAPPQTQDPHLTLLPPPLPVHIKDFSCFLCHQKVSRPVGRPLTQPSGIPPLPSSWPSGKHRSCHITALLPKALKKNANSRHGVCSPTQPALCPLPWVSSDAISFHSPRSPLKEELAQVYS